VEVVLVPKTPQVQAVHLVAVVGMVLLQAALEQRALMVALQVLTLAAAVVALVVLALMVEVPQGRRVALV